MNKEKPHLPVMGVGPIYVIIIVFITVTAVFLNIISKAGAIDMGVLNVPAKLLGALLILGGISIWVKAVLKGKVDQYIKKNQLMTIGIYAWVRNPIYSAFLFLCAGVLLFCNNLILLSLPFFYWIFLSILMVYTEEKWLEKEFGAEYLAYKSNVNRCIPFPPKCR